MLRSITATCLLVLPLTLAEAAKAVDDAKDVEDYLKLAADYYAKGQHDQAISVMDDAIRLYPKSAIAFSCRGAIRFSRKEYDRAIADLDEAIRLEPGKAYSGYNNRGAAWYMKKEYAKGVKDLDEAIKLDPKDSEALNSRAWAAATCPDAKYRDTAKALDYAKRACELDGWKNPFYFGTIAAAYAENGDFENAVKWQRKALEDQLYLKEYGEQGRMMLKHFEQKKPYREEAGKDK